MSLETAMEKSSSEIGISDQDHHRIRKAFNLLKSHTSAVATFTLKWQELEDHLQSIQNSIQSTLYHLQNPNPNPNPVHKPPPSQFNGIPIRDGHKLLRYLKGRDKNHDSLRGSVRAALAAAEDPAGLVLTAVSKFFPQESGAAAKDPSEITAVRKSCLLLLEEVAKAGPEIGGGARDEAAKVAAEWKKKMTETASPMEVTGFLMLLNSYGLVGDFDGDEIVSLFGKVAQRLSSVELFRSLGFSDKASDLIQTLISQQKIIEALRFIYAFELVDKFAPVPLLQGHVKETKKDANVVWKKGKSSSKEKDEATSKEIIALRNVIKCIEDYNLESEYPSESLKQRIEWLKSEKKERKTKENKVKRKSLGPNSQASQLSGNKRGFPDAQQNRFKHPRVGPVTMAPLPNLPARLPVAVHHVHRSSVGMLESERSDYLIPSAMMTMPSGPADSQNMQARAAAAYTMQHRQLTMRDGEGRQYLPSKPLSSLYPAEASQSHYQPSSSYTSPGAQYSPRYYSMERSALDARLSLPSGARGYSGSPTQRTSTSTGLTRDAYNLTGYVPTEPQRSIATAHYGLTNSDSENIDSLAERYQLSGRTGQFGLSRTQPSDIPHGSSRLQASDIASNRKSPPSSLAYYPGGSYSERPVSSSGNYELLSNGSYGYQM